MSNLRLQGLFAAAVAASALAACGGGGSDGPAPAPAAAAPVPATSAVPDSASQTVGGFITYLKLLYASTGTDTLEPVDISKVTPAISDTAEPDGSL